MVASLSSLSVTDRARLLGSVDAAMLPLRGLTSVSGENHVEWSIDNWTRQASEVIEVDREIAIVQFLPWDTEQLGIRTGRVHLFGSSQTSNDDRWQKLATNVVAWAQDNQIRFVDAKIPTNNLYRARFLEQAGFHIVDTLVTIRRNIGPEDSCSHHTIRHAISEDLPALESLSRSAYGDLEAIQDRFFLEAEIAHDRASELFVAWIRNSYNKQKNGRGVILVAEERNELLGYIALEQLDEKIFPGCWYDSLNAIDERARGRGVYKSLMRSAFSELRARGAQTLITKTQVSNARVINAWLHAGASILESHVTLHWIK